MPAQTWLPLNGLSWPSISFVILTVALLLSAYILWRRYQSRHTLMQRVAELEALSGAGRALVESELDEIALCELIAAEAGKIIDNTTFQVGIFDDDLYQILFWQINGERQETPQTFDLSSGSGIVGWVRQSRQPLLVRDFLREAGALPAQPRYISQSPPRSALFLPLIASNDVIGILAAQHTQPARFSEEDLRRLMILANQAAAAIAHARLFSQERKRAAHLTLVAQMAHQLNRVHEIDDIFDQVVHLTRETFGFHPVSIFLRDPASGDLMMQASSDPQLAQQALRVPAGHGLVGTAVSRRTSVVSNNTADDARYLDQIANFAPSQVSATQSEMVLPLLVNNEVLGVLDVQSDTLGSFTDADESTLEALAAEVAVAIEITQQLMRQRMQNWLTTTQLQYAETISQSSEQESLADNVTRLTAMLLGADICAILLWDEFQEAYTLTGAYCTHGRPELDATLPIGAWPPLDAVHIGQEAIVTHQAPPWRVADRQPLASPLHLLPMHTTTQMVGVFVVTHPAPKSGLTHQQIQQQREELLHNVTRQTAQAFESMALRAAQQEEAWVNTVLLQVAEAVNSLFDLNEILDTIVRLIPMLVGVESTVVLFWDEAQAIYRLGPSYGVSVMGRGLLATLALDQDELETLGPQRAGAFSPTSGYYAMALPHWLEQAMGAPAGHAFPLHAQGRLVGLLIVGVAEKNGALTHRRLAILNGIAQQAATAVINNQLYKESAERSRLEQELNVAREIQASLIPPGSPRIPGCDVASYWEAARQVSGDFYDFLPLQDEKWGIVIADVADKGMPAALFMALSRTVLRTVAFNRLDPADVLIRTNTILDSDAQTDLFVTAFYAVWDPHSETLRYANGGHNPPLLLRRNGATKALTGNGIALGVLPEVEIECHQIRFQPGDTLIFYTDGVTEAINEDLDEFGVERLLISVNGRRRQSAADVVRTITQAVQRHAGDTQQFDDITLVVMKRLHEYA